MDQLVDTLQQLPPAQWAAVVHLGAGHGAALPALNALNAERLLLVEGDPDALLVLRRRNDLPAAVQIRGAVVGTEPGKTQWHRYTMAAMNGPLDALVWTPVYPRLRLISSVPVEVLSMQTTLTEAVDGLRAPGPNLLVLDLPGQDAALLAAVSGELLRRFEWVVVRGCAAPSDPRWPPVSASVEHLVGMGYALQSTPTPADPLWPVVMLRFDATAYRLQQLQRQIQALQLHGTQVEAELRKAEQQNLQAQAALQAAQQSGAALEQTLAEARARAQSAAQDFERERDALVSARAEQDRMAAAQVQRVGVLETEKVQLTGERDALAKSRTELTAALDVQTRLAAECKLRLDELGKEKVQLVNERDALTKVRTDLTTARDEQAKLATERQQRVDALTKDKALLVTERDALVKERAGLIAARDEQTKSARDANQKVVALDGEMAEMLARHGLLQEELIKAEAQIELIADVLLREPRT